MNTRGLMELIVLNIGLDLQVISPTLFAMGAPDIAAVSSARRRIGESLCMPPLNWE
jgi:hypothetical protein